MNEEPTQAVPSASTPTPTLRVLIKTQDLVLLTLGVVIGSGIFLVPGLVLRQSGNVVWLAALVWLIGGGLSVLGALSYAELGALKPSAGGLYVYIRDIFGERAAFLFGWSMFFIIGSGAVATLAVAFATYAGELVNLSAGAGKVLSVSLIAAIAWINVSGTRSSLHFQNWTTWAKLVGLFLLAGTLVMYAGPSHPTLNAPVLQATGSPFAGVALALVSALWAYEGWQWSTFAASEVVKPQSTLPRGLLLGTLVLVAVYLVANFSYVRALGPERLAGSTRVAADALNAVGLPRLSRLVTVLIMISIASAANGSLMTTSRVYFAMAADGLFFRAFAKLSPTRQVPASAIIASAVWACALALTGTFQQLLSWVVTIGWGFYALGAACLFGYRWRYPGMPSAYRVPGYPFTPVIFILGAAGVVIMAAVREPRAALMGVLFLAVGLGVDAVRRAAFK
jgi:APA family basic amino acid/polyamine antiporter